MSTLSVIASRYAECVEWLEACPFTEGQAFYETANRELEEMYEAMLELASPEIAETIHAAFSEGEWYHHSEADFWRGIAERSERNTE